MSLTLQIENFSVLDDGGPVSVSVPASGLQAGRNAGMGWVLPDASRHISGHHFDVIPQGGHYWLHDRSTNGTFLQGHRHRLDGAHQLSHGERFQVGQYIIVALLDAPAAQPGMKPGSLPRYDVGAAAPDLPADEDPWAVPGGFEPVNPMPVETAARHDDFAGDFVAFPTAPQGASPFDAPAEPRPEPAPAPLPPAPDAPSASGPVPPQATPAPHPAPPQATGASGADFVLAFCRGAGLSAELAEGVDGEALAERLGQAMAATTARLMAGLRDRSSARHFTRAGERTMRGATDNNPLKFLPSAEQALEAAFLRPRAGFMTGAEGYDGALADLARHQSALFAALQPALAELLQDLDPGRIEAEAKGGLTGQKKARAWEAYVALWDAKAAHENGILDEFIRLFAQAYRAADAAGDTGI
ncbi:MAG: type VI secretion system-associated FHA domain protein TagH [Paracoccus sp. (in: a-proteobacteria)]|nr:type VI secretion system-associated FHA domain protein TagH [Paracoccus sp. (in: a-proteobacteria)]